MAKIKMKKLDHLLSTYIFHVLTSDVWYIWLINMFMKLQIISGTTNKADNYRNEPKWQLWLPPSSTAFEKAPGLFYFKIIKNTTLSFAFDVSVQACLCAIPPSKGCLNC